MDRTKEFEKLTNIMLDTYIRKNADYGNAFSESVKKYGPVVGLIRLEDKFRRLENLLTNNIENKVKDESIKDTLLDMANYALMLYMEI